MLRRRVQRSPQRVLHAPLGFLIAVLVVVFVIAHAVEYSMQAPRFRRRKGRDRKPPAVETTDAIPAPEKPEWLLEEFLHATDRHAVILASANLEQTLERGIISVLKNKDNTTRERLTDRDGALSGFFAKIYLGYALGLYNAQTRDNLDNVRRIRNRFAHSPRFAMTLKDDKDVVKWMGRLNATLDLEENLSQKVAATRKTIMEKQSATTPERFEFIVNVFALLVSISNGAHQRHEDQVELHAALLEKMEREHQ